jgi:hypothetical protein
VVEPPVDFQLAYSISNMGGNPVRYGQGYYKRGIPCSKPGCLADSAKASLTTYKICSAVGAFVHFY